MRKRAVLAGGAGLLLVGVLAVSLVAIAGQEDSTSVMNPSVVVAESIQPDGDSFTGAYDGPDIDELIAKLPEDEQKMARLAFEKNEYVNIFEGENITVLVQVGAVRLHPDPAADRDFVEGRTDQPDPRKDQAYWDYIESGPTDDIPIVGAETGEAEVTE